MPIVGRITAKFDADTKSLDASLKGMEGAVDGTAIKVTHGFNTMEKSLKRTQDSVAQLASGEQLKAGADAFASIAGAVDGFRQEMDRAGGQADDLRDRLAATFGDLADEKAKLAEKSLELGFDASSTADALVTLHKFGADSEETLTKLQDAARFTNTSIDGLAESFGKFAKFGDGKSLLALQKELGVSGADMEKFGAKIDGANKVLVDTPVRLDAAKKAMQAYMDLNFTGAAQRQADAGTQLAGKIEELKRQVGLTTVAFKDQFAPALISVVDSLIGASDSTKTFIGVGAEVVGMTANAASGIFSLGANLVIMSQNATVASLATRAMALASAAMGSSLALALGPVGLVAIGFAAYINSMNEATAAQEEMIRMSEKSLTYYRKHTEEINIAAAAVKRFGGATEDAVDQIVRNLARLGKNKVEITGAIAGALGSVVEVEAKIAQLPQDYQAGKITSAEYQDQMDKAQADLLKLKAIEEGLRQARKQAPEAPREDAKSPAAVADESEKERKRREAQEKKDAAIKEKARAADVASQISAIKLEATQGKLSVEQQIAGYQAIANSAGISAKERIALALTIAGLEKGLRDKATAEQKKAEDDRTRDAAKSERERAAESKRQAADSAREKKKAEADAAKAAKKDDSEDKADLSKIEQLAKEKIAAETKAEDAAQAAAESERGTAKNNAAIKKATAVIEAVLKRKLELTILEINMEKAATIAATKNEDIKTAATVTAEAKIQAARAASTNDLAKNVADQKKAMDDLVRADKTAKDTIANQVGGSNSPLSSDPGTGFSLGSFSLNGFSLGSASSQIKKQPTATITPFSSGVTDGAALTAASQVSTISAMAADIGTQVADAIKSTPIAITVVANVDGQSVGQQTFSGTADQLASKANIFSSSHIMGKV